MKTYTLKLTMNELLYVKASVKIRNPKDQKVMKLKEAVAKKTDAILHKKFGW